jgi:hypothetical protein
MRKLMLLSLLFVFLFSASQASLDSGLVAYYPLNGDAVDYSLNGHNGTMNDVVFDSQGVFGQCAVFNGSSSTINTNYLFNFGTGDFSISLWFNYVDLNQTGAFLSKRINDSIGFDLEIVPWSKRRVNFYGAESANKVVWPPYPTDYALEVWHNIVFVKNGINYSVYVDNSLQGSEDSPFGAININNYLNVELGIYRGVFPRGGYYSGKLDEVRFYNRALTLNEVALLFNTPVKKYIDISYVPDMNNNGSPEIVGLIKQGNTNSCIVVVVDGLTNEQLKEIAFFNPQWTPESFAIFDINNDSVQEVSVVASMGDSTKIESRKISDGSFVRTIIMP